MFTVKQLSKLAGVTPRTLHHYDDIGLLKPSRIGDNGYRYYEEDALLQLQQILFYRELDMPLEDIKMIMAESRFDVLGALYSHKEALNKQAARISRQLFELSFGSPLKNPCEILHQYYTVSPQICNSDTYPEFVN